MPDLLLNLSAWIDRRKKEIGPHSSHIINSTLQYEAEIQRLRDNEEFLRDCLADRGINTANQPSN